MKAKELLPLSVKLFKKTRKIKILTNDEKVLFSSNWRQLEDMDENEISNLYKELNSRISFDKEKNRDQIKNELENQYGFSEKEKEIKSLRNQLAELNGKNKSLSEKINEFYSDKKNIDKVKEENRIYKGRIKYLENQLASNKNEEENKEKISIDESKKKEERIKKQRGLSRKQKQAEKVKRRKEKIKERSKKNKGTENKSKNNKIEDKRKIKDKKLKPPKLW